MDNKFTLSKSERLCDAFRIMELLNKGERGRIAYWGRYRFLKDNGLNCNRILISVPKRLFKRAVKRNLIKRRMREAYRQQKHILNNLGVDIMFIYNYHEIITFKEFFEGMTEILKEINFKFEENAG